MTTLAPATAPTVAKGTVSSNELLESVSMLIRNLDLYRFGTSILIETNKTLD